MIKVKYNKDSGFVEGFFPDELHYWDNVIDIKNRTIDGSPYIEISREKHADIIKNKLRVVSNGEFVPYVKTEQEVFEQKKNSMIKKRKNYLKETDWQASAYIKYERPIDQEVKENCLIAISELNQLRNSNSLQELENFSSNF